MPKAFLNDLWMNSGLQRKSCPRVAKVVQTNHGKVVPLDSASELHVLRDEVARKTARQWEYYVSSADRHLAALKEILDEEEPEYSH